MTREEIIRIARECGFDTKRLMVFVGDVEITLQLERFAALAAAAEREACAEVCDEAAGIRSDAGKTHPEDSESRGRCFAGARAATSCAEAIRARGNA